MIRLDKLVIEQTGFSREYAAEVIKGGYVSSGEKILAKPGMKVPHTLEIIVSAKPMRYVSRGGYKLEQALAEFGVVVEGKTCVDIGASVGGFTDCLLQNGALLVAAIDCGTAQLANKLRNDARVTVFENTNIREINAEEFLRKTNLNHGFDVAVIDVSFISLSLVLPAAASLLRQSGTLICLVKPQFEAGKAALNKRGVVKSERLRLNALDAIKQAATLNKFHSITHAQSPITGRDGNIEYLMAAKKGYSHLPLYNNNSSSSNE